MIPGLTPVISSFNPAISNFNPVISNFNPVISSFNPVIPSFTPVISSFNPVISSFNPVISSFNPVIPGFTPVIPAKAGIHTDLPPKPYCPVSSWTCHPREGGEPMLALDSRLRGNDDFLRGNDDLLLSDHHDVDFDLAKVPVGVIQTDKPVPYGHHLCQ
ncbi:hypothetical protein [Endozoicomonas sp. 8E]|uniref:hypothetical protein n=1 Tax=Endozoicomonas sp. 8E TaxID=3035692 RepID=UPI002938FC42|nr:hypothetical protein [Endozoicomonas sp. 8E]WOG28536.1 hypothetical protein P6910_02450 [Endozoicomonas sp. 8E]